MKTRFFGVAGLIGVAAVVTACGAATTDESVDARPVESTVDTAGKTPSSAPLLNLSHIVCNADGSVDVHFVLLFWGNAPPPDLTATTNQGTFTTSWNKHSGNVWHYDITLKSGFVEVTAASVGDVQLHNAGDYTDTYACGPQPPACSVAPNLTGTQCAGPSSIGGNSPSNVCGWLGLSVDTLIGRDEGPFVGDTTIALETAYVAVVKGGSGGASQLVCGTGTSVYNIYQNVTAGQTLSTGNGTGVSDVTYCRCPDQ